MTRQRSWRDFAALRLNFRAQTLVNAASSLENSGAVCSMVMRRMDAFFLYLSHTRMPVTIGWLVALLVWESAAPFFGFFQRRGTERLAHGVKNLLVGAASAIFPALGFVSLLAAVTAWTEARDFGLLNVLPVAAFAHALGALLILDVFTYWWHWANHRVPFLWRFHRVHHADFKMDVTTANRFHVGEIAMSSLLRVPLLWLTGIQLSELALFETAMLLVVQFHHANIGVGPRLDKLLRLVIVTPAMHKVHHSRFQPETDSNFTALLSVWDRLFRSFRLRDDPHTIEFGLDDFAAPEHQTLRGLYAIPLVKARQRDT
jgi:sterol desaturase/sphingolipid hydroxylase (fatty acid hydroxylase superfamily)